MKKTMLSILVTLLLVAAIPAVLVLASPDGFALLSPPTGEPTIEATATPEPSIEITATPTPGITLAPPITAPPEPTPEIGGGESPVVQERIAAAAALGIPPGRLLLLDRLAATLGWTREQVLAQYGNASVKDIMKATNEYRHGGQGHHPVPSPLPTPVPTLAPTATPTAEPTVEPTAAPTEVPAP
jgi:hypothetical protein